MQKGARSFSGLLGGRWQTIFRNFPIECLTRAFDFRLLASIRYDCKPTRRKHASHNRVAYCGCPNTQSSGNFLPADRLANFDDSVHGDDVYPVFLDLQYPDER